MNLFSDKPRMVYINNPIVEVICQLRFPAILSINMDNSEDLVKYQSKIRKSYPEYKLNYEQQQRINIPALIDPSGSDAKITSTTIKNHCFQTADGSSKINLTSSFIAFSTSNYSSWEEYFAGLSTIHQAFIDVFEPSYYDRIGLRYIDAFNKSGLGLEKRKWCELINPIFLGVLSASDTSENRITNSAVDAHIKLDHESDLYYLKLHTGLAKIENSLDTHFILDSDFYTSEKISCSEYHKPLDYLHSFSGKLIRSCILDDLETALGVKI